MDDHRIGEDSRPASARAKLQQLASAGGEIAQMLERGQAEAPIAELFEVLERDVRAAPLCVALVGLTVEARAAALGWLCGQDHRVFTVCMPERPGLLDIQLLDRSYVLETPEGQRREFAEPGELLEAVRGSDSGLTADEGRWLDPLRVQLPADRSRQGLTVLVVEGASALRDQPGLLAYLLSRSHVLAVAAPAHYAWPDAEHTPLDDAVAAFPVLLPVVTVSGVGIPTGWWTTLGARSELALQPLILSGEAGPAAPAEQFARLRGSLALAGLARRAIAGCELVADRQDTLLRQAAARQKREARRESGAGQDQADQDIRAATDRVKAQIGDDLTKLNGAIRESSRRSLLRSGPIRERAALRIQGVAEADLVREPGVRSIRLSVQPAFVGEVMRELRKAVRRQLDADLMLLRDGIGELRRRAEETLSGALPVAASLPLNPPDDRTVWAAMKELLDVEIRYRGEIPKRSFMQRLGEGRRLVFALLMVVSLGGSFLGLSNIRGLAWVGLIFLLIFIGSVIFTYRSWSREDEESLTKELDKVRDTLASEVSRVLADVEREKLAKLGAELDEIRKAALQAVEQALRDAQARRLRIVEQQRREARAVLQNIESRVRELQNLGREVGRLSASAAEVDRLVRSLLQDHAKPPPGPAAAVQTRG